MLVWILDIPQEIKEAIFLASKRRYEIIYIFKHIYTHAHHIHIVKYYPTIKINLYHLRSMDGPRGIKQNKSDIEKTNSVWFHLYVESEI